jgi:hypothetical protein
MLDGLKVAEPSWIEPPAVGQVTGVMIEQLPPVWIRAPVGLAPTDPEVVFWNEFWLIHMTAVNVEYMML